MHNYTDIQDAYSEGEEIILSVIIIECITM